MSKETADDRAAAGAWIVLAVVAAALGGVIALVVGGWRSPKPTSPPASPRSVSGARGPEADWCAPGFEPLAGDGCFAPSATAPAGRPLLVYLHGRYAADAAADEVDRQRRLALRATARGFSVLALRGRLGTCSAPELASWYCWPSNERNADAAQGFVNAWQRALSVAGDRAGTRALFLFGFSNGGYFAGLIASRALLDLEAAVVAHGGPVEPVRAASPRPPPLLLLSADDDVAQDEMIRFDDELGREGWPHDSYARFGGHALTDEDIDAALSFFERSREPLPLRPPLPLHRAVLHAREAGVDEGAAGPSTEAAPGDEAAPASEVPSFESRPTESPSAESLPTESPSAESPPTESPSSESPSELSSSPLPRLLPSPDEPDTEP